MSCNGDTDGSIDLTVNGGVDNQAYSYTWSNGQTSEDITGLGIGSYNVTVTDVNGCLLSDSTNISQPDVLTSGLLSLNQTICANEILDTIFTITSLSGGNPPYTYDWEINDGNGFVPLSNNNLNWILPQNIVDTITYRITYSDDFQCNTFYDSSITIINPMPISFPVIGDMIVCSNQSDASYTLATTPSNYRYDWFTNDGTFVGTNQSINCIVNWPSLPNTSLEIAVDVWIYESGCQITETASIDLSQNDAPNKSLIEKMANTNILVCNDTSFGIQYQWGYTVIDTEVDVIDTNHTGQYNQFENTIDTTINRYWVLTSYNYGNDICNTKSFYNPPPLPLNIINNDLEISFYPNPVKDFLNWNGNKLESIKVYDSMGRIISCEVNYQNKKIDFNNCTPGLYFLEYRANSNKFINKIIVK